jgi:two-component system sensor histidine kinase UhpB
VDGRVSAPGASRGTLLAGPLASLLLATCLPVAVGFALAAAILDLSSRSDEHDELTARARLVAVALAESAQYDIVQGDKDAARRSMQAILGADPTVVQIVLLDATRTPMLAFGDLPRDAGHVSVEVATQQVNRSTPERQRLSQPPNGFVRVYMSSTALGKSKQAARRRGQIALVLSAIASIAIGLAITRRFRSQLNASLDAMRSLANPNTAGTANGQGAALSNRDYGPFQRAVTDLIKVLTESHQRAQDQVALRTRDLSAIVSDQARRTQAKERLLDHDHKVIERERARIAREIHDQLGGGVVSIRLHAEALARKAGKSGQAELAAEASHIVQRLNALYDEAREITRKLRPEVLEMLGLRGAVQELVRQLDETHPDCTFTFHPDESAPNPAGDLSIVAFRVVQEALTNIVKHADARHVDVTLSRAEQPRQVRMVVADDGVGFGEKAEASGGLGLMSMRERVERAGGVLSMTSGPAGTVLTFVI